MLNGEIHKMEMKKDWITIKYYRQSLTLAKR